MNYKLVIENIINTQNGITTSGRDNWDRLLGCDQALRAILADMQQHEAEKEAEKAEKDQEE